MPDRDCTPMSVVVPLDSAVQKWLARVSPAKSFSQSATTEISKKVRAIPFPADLYPEIETEERIIPGGPTGHVRMQLFRPSQNIQRLPVILYMPGLDFGFSNSTTHGRLISELCIASQAMVIVANVQLPPYSSFPCGIEESYTALKWIAENGRQHGFDSSRLVVAGDGCGGNLASALTILSKQRSGPAIHRQILICPATDASTQSQSYHDFASGFGLQRDQMQQYWQQYVTQREQRNEIFVSPLRADIDQLQGLPAAFILTAEADILRDEAEAYAAKLQLAGVPVTHNRFSGTIHYFMVLDALSETSAARAALNLTVSWLLEAFQSNVHSEKRSL